MSRMWQSHHSPPEVASWPFALTGPGEPVAPDHVAGRCHCQQLHSPLEVAALNAAPRMLPTRPDKIERNEAFGPGSKTSLMHDMTGSALARGGQADTEAQPGQRVRRQLGEAHFQPPTPPKAASLMPELYTLGDIARALGMQVASVRRWDYDGILPAARRHTEGSDKGWGTTGRKRRYTTAEFNMIVRIAIDEHVAARSITGHARANVRETEFASRVRAAWEKLTDTDPDRAA
jgi:hypothetical protein